MRASLFFAAVLMSLNVQAQVADDPIELHEQARSAIQLLDFETAQPLLERAAAANPPRAVKTQIFVDLGICYVNLGEQDRAVSAFVSALESDADLQLPRGLSPKVSEAYSKARAQVAAAPKPDAPKTTAPPIVTAPPKQAAKPIDDAFNADEPASVSREVAPVSPRWMWPAVMGGVAAAGLGAGIYGATSSQRSAAELEGGLHDRARANALLAEREQYNTVSYAGYGVAAGAAVVGALLFVIHPGSSATVSPSAPGGPGATAAFSF